MFRRWVKRYFKLYDFEDLQIGGTCGCCGVWIPREIVLKNWPYGLCKNCVSTEH